ncbi:MAG: peptidoglycan-binding protein [Candidatus Omnitrophica bacterium]|nr:peptidoglycan-binding protein [Candidatus Omnitrophota bacterium]
MRSLSIVLLLSVVLFLVGGCATARKNADLETQGLRNQVALLDAQIQSRDEEINNLKVDLAQAKQELQSRAKVKEISLAEPQEPFVRPSARQVQTALKNAGYYSGRIDGMMGKQSRQALKSFQAANNLRASGKLNRKTWELLKVYLDKKPVQSGVGSSKEIG